MGLALGPIGQLGIVTRDMRAATEYWDGQINSGPFQVHDLSMPSVIYRGRSINVKVEIAIGYASDMQIEIISQPGDEPSIYKEYLDRFGIDFGLHHIAYFSNSFNSSILHCEENGFELVQHGVSPLDATTRYAYLETARGNWPCIELIELSAAKERRYRELRRASEQRQVVSEKLS